jgi:multidrug efflux system membrane fusion protein
MADRLGERQSKGVNPINETSWRNGQPAVFRYKRLLFAIGFIVVAIVAGFLLQKAFTKGKVEQAQADGIKKEIPTVFTATATLQSLPLEVHNIGNVEPFSIVNVIAQVGGQLTHVYFTQGQDVKRGQLLFQIDPREYQAQLQQAEANVVRDQSQIQSAQANLNRDIAASKQAEANLARDQAQLRYADVEVDRYQELVKAGAVSHEQSDQVSTTSQTASATVLSDKAAVENSKAVISADKAAIAQAKASLVADQSAAENLRIQLGFTEIRSPVDGVAGSLNVNEGNVVRANDTTALVTINQIAPIYVTFSVPETNLDQIRQAELHGTLSVRANVDGDRKNPVEGKLCFIDNTVDKTTGAIKLRAVFGNADRVLWPGRFVSVAVTLPQPQPQIVIPSRAVQSDQQGQSVFKVNADSTVTFTPVLVDRTHGDSTVLSKGLKTGDIVVIDGQLKLTPGATVKVMASPKAAASS